MTTATSSAQTLTRDPISLILPLLTLREFATLAVVISRAWYSTAQMMRSRRERLDQVLVYNSAQWESLSSTTASAGGSDKINSTNVRLPASAWYTLHTSPLRHHVTHLEARLSISANSKLSSVPGEFTSQLESIAHSMSHLESLTIITSMSDETPDPPLEPTQTTSSSSTPCSLKANAGIDHTTPLYPPRLKCLKFIFDGNPPRWWIKRLFKGITLVPTLSQSLLILESTIAGSRIHPSACVADFYKLKSLRRLAFRSDTMLAIDGDAMPSIRAIPSLCEFEGCQQGRRLNQLVAASPPHAWRRLGDSPFSAQSHLSLIHVGQQTEFPPPTPIDIDLLLSTSSGSLTELTVQPTVAPVFLSQFTRLRALRIQFYGRVPQFSRDDIVSGISACHQLERLHFDGYPRSGMILSEMEIESMLRPLIHLEYLVLTKNTRLDSIEFLNRLHHLHQSLHYFSFSSTQWNVESESITEALLVDYHRPVYSLTQLRLLHIQGSSMMESRLQILDVLFRPRHQLLSSYRSLAQNDRQNCFGAYEERRLGMLPVQYLPHLNHFTQSWKPEDKPEWQKVVAQFELNREKELLQPATEKS